MISGSKFSGALLAAIVTLTASPLLASDNYNSHRGHHGQSWQGGSSAPGLPSVVPGLGTFSGSVAAVRIRNNGIYFSRTANPWASTAYRKQPASAPMAKVIHVNAATAKNACSFESGVCVIRPPE